MPRYSEICAAVAQAGLSARGVLALAPPERTGALAPMRALLLLGVVGARDWPAFAASPEAGDGAPDPLDRWSRRVVGALAARWGALALYPFDGPPYWPFASWARRAEPVWPSPLGLTIHPEYGLSHSYRGALAFTEPVATPARAVAPSPCLTCSGQPCLGACPVGAFTGRSYDVESCAAHLRAAEGAPCREGGCLARRACPVGPAFAQSPAQARFHMRAFLAARGVSP